MIAQIGIIRALLFADPTVAAQIVAYIDDFPLLMFATLLALPLVLLFREPVPTPMAELPAVHCLATAGDESRAGYCPSARGSLPVQ
jgi:hypothetical protein